MGNESIDKLRNCPDCKGDVTELIRDDEESIIKCRSCKRVWTISELWNASEFGHPQPSADRLNAMKEALRPFVTGIGAWYDPKANLTMAETELDRMAKAAIAAMEPLDVSQEELLDAIYRYYGGHPATPYIVGAIRSAGYRIVKGDA